MGQRVDTKHVDGRRDLHFTSVDEALADVDRIVEADRAGTLRRLGNWTVGQNFEHVGMLIKGSYDGLDFKAPLGLRVIVKLFRKKFLRDPFPSGIKLRGSFEAVIPRSDFSTEEGAAYIREQLLRIKSGEKMTQPSPLLGKVTHDEWVGIHLKHADLHFSFLIPGDPRGEEAPAEAVAAGA